MSTLPPTKPRRPVHEVIVLIFAWMVAGIFTAFTLTAMLRPGTMHDDVRATMLEDMKLIILLVAGYIAGHANPEKR